LAAFHKIHIWQAIAIIDILIVLCAVYGGVNLSTWNFDFEFPTPIGRKLWRLSCISTVAGSLFAPGFSYWSVAVFEEIGFVARTKLMITIVRNRNVGKLSRFFALVILFTPLLLAARLFLVVESFISVRDIPSGVYTTVPWAQYIPHI
jgi:hypothetical protein